MTLRKKTLLIVIGTLAFLMAAVYFVTQYSMKTSFSSLEESIARENVERAVSALDNDIQTLNATVGDWAGWDDTYRFIEDHNTAYIKANLTSDSSFLVNSLNLILYIDASGRIVYGKGYHLSDKKELPVPESLFKDYLKAGSPLLGHKGVNSSVTGIVLLPEGPMLIASRPIITSDLRGPIRGTLIMGRYLNTGVIERLSNMTQLAIAVYLSDDRHMPQDVSLALSRIEAGNPITVRPLDGEAVAGYTLLKDIFGRPGLIIKVVMPRDVFNQWWVGFIYNVAFILAAGLVFGIMMFYLLEMLILSRLATLSGDVGIIGEKGDFSARVPVEGNDELSGLALTINSMLEALEHSRSDLKKSEENYRRVFEENMVGIFTSDHEGEILGCNSSFARIMGFQSAEEAKRANAFSLCSEPGESEHILGLLKKNKKLELFELVIVRANGQRADLMTNITGTFDETGTLQKIDGFILDITWKKKAAEDLEKTRARYKELVDSLPVCIYETTLEGLFTLANKMSFSMFGYELEDFENGLRAVDMVAPQDRELVTENIKRVANGEIVGNQEYMALKKDGTIFPVVNHSSPITSDGVPTGIRGILMDITEIKRTQEALRESEEKYRTILESIEDAYFEVDLAGNILFFNRAGFEMTGYSKEELMGANYKLYTLPEDVPRVYSAYNGIYRTGKLAKLFDWVIVRKDGGRRFFEASVSLIIDANGKATGFRGLARDITERKKVEEKLRESEEKYRLVFVNSPLGIMHFDRYGAITACNDKIEVLVEAAQENLVGVNLLSLPDKKLVSAVNKALSGELSHYEGDYQIGARAKAVPVKADFAPIKIGEKDIIGGVAIVEDITERKLSEKKLRFLSFHDALTGIYNRAYFEQEMKRLEAGRNFTAGIIVCDVDGLKLVNDTLGHEKGDTLLVAAAAVLRNSFRESDVVARIGGDEFAVLLPGSSRVVVEEAFKRAKRSVEKYNLAHSDLPLSMSMGFAANSGKDVRMIDLFKEADNSMYREKLHSRQSARSSIVQALMKALEERDFITEGHAGRLPELMEEMAVTLGLPERRLADLRLLAKFHDIGKVGIPDRILFKKGPLTSEEWLEMQRHSEIGHRIALSAPELAPVAEWILKHHEHWDGSGYPLGIKGEEIPLACRILAIADAYDAMTSNRPYRQAVSHDEAIAELKRCSGTKFDPKLLRVFIEVLEVLARSR